MSHENGDLQYLRDNATAVGEIVAVTADSITIGGSFSPGMVIPLHPGARVVVFTDDDLLDLPVPSNGIDL